MAAAPKLDAICRDVLGGHRGCRHPIFEHRILPQPEEYETVEAYHAAIRRWRGGCLQCRCREEHAP